MCLEHFPESLNDVFFFLKNKTEKHRAFPGGPVVKTSPSNAGGAGSIPGRGAKIPRASRPENQNIKQTIL